MFHRVATGTTSLSNWLSSHPRAVFVPPPEAHDYREAHVFDNTPKFWHGVSMQGRREVLSPVASSRDTVIDCKRGLLLLLLLVRCCVVVVVAAAAVLAVLLS